MTTELIRGLPAPRQFKSVEDASKYAQDLYSALSRWTFQTPTANTLTGLPWVTPEQFGKNVGTGGDDTAAIQAAATAIATTGGTVAFSSKSYNFTSLSIVGKIRLVGVSKFASVLNCTMTSGNGILINVPHESTTASSPCLENFSVIGPGSGTGNGITITSGYEGFYKNVFVKSFGNDGWHMETTGGVSNADGTQFMNCNSHHNGRYGFYISPDSKDSNLVQIVGGSAFENQDGYFLDSNWCLLMLPDGSFNTRYGFNFNNAGYNNGRIYAESCGTKEVYFSASSGYNEIFVHAGGIVVEDLGNCNTYHDNTDELPAWSNFRLASITPTDNPLRIKNKRDAGIEVRIVPGLTAEYAGTLTFADKSGAPVWAVFKGDNNSFWIYDYNRPSAAPRLLLEQDFSGSSSTYINSVGGTGQIFFNQMSGSGTGGLSVYGGGVTPALQFRIDSSGNIYLLGNAGIGTGTPFAKITIPSGSGYNGMYAVEAAADANSRRWWIHTDYHAYGDFSISTETSKQHDVTPNLPRLYIGPTGNVGIGTVTPGSALAVAGLPSYLTDALADAGGLTSGDLYTVTGTSPLLLAVKI